MRRRHVPESAEKVHFFDAKSKTHYWSRRTRQAVWNRLGRLAELMGGPPLAQGLPCQQF